MFSSRKAFSLLCFLVIAITGFVFAEEVPLLLQRQPTRVHIPLYGQYEALGSEEVMSEYDAPVYELAPYAPSEKDLLRDEWEGLLKVDVFGPYFRARQIGYWFQERAHVKVLNLDGNLELEVDEARYIFKLRF